jgi:outer membrane murein-binding lipoprotein Lpp
MNKWIMAAAVLGGVLMVAGCGSGTDNTDPNKNPNYSEEAQTAPKKDTKGGFVPDFSIDR